MAENSAIVAEYSAKEKELWPSIRQKKKRIVAEYSAKEKELWLSIQQNMAEVSAREKKYGWGFSKFKGLPIW